MADYFVSVDSRYQDFIVFNGDEPLSNEEITNEDIEFIDIKGITNLKSIAWNCHCRWFFVMQPDCIYLINVYDNQAVRCNKKSSKFFEMYLRNNSKE